jgi:predicted RNase H-like HicB family nuclease
MADTEIIFSVQESPEGGFEARALGFPIFTQADTLEELKAMVQDAVRCHFEPQNAPRLIRLRATGFRELEAVSKPLVPDFDGNGRRRVKPCSPEGSKLSSRG